MFFEEDVFMESSLGNQSLFKPEGNVLRLPELMGYVCLVHIIQEKL